MTWVGSFKSLQSVLRKPRFTGAPLQVHTWVRSEIGLISPLVDWLMSLMVGSCCVFGEEESVELALREALSNAMLHGNRLDAVGNTTCFAYDALHRATSTTYTGPYAANTPNKYFVYDTATENSVSRANAKTRLPKAYTDTPQSGTKITAPAFTYTAHGELTEVYQPTPPPAASYQHP